MRFALRNHDELSRLLLDMIVDLSITQTTKKELAKRFGQGAVAGIEFETNKIYLLRTQPHPDKVRSLLHELAHYHMQYNQGIDAEKQDEEKVEELATRWQSALYGGI